MGNFVRGGQVTMLNIRMVRQVLMYLWYASLAAILIVTPIYVYKKTDSNDLALVFSYYVAACKVALGQPGSGVNIFLHNGTRVPVTAGALVNNPIAIANKDWLIGTILDAIRMTLTAMAGLAVFVTIYFVYMGRKIGSASFIRGGIITTPKILRKLILRDNKKLKVKSYELAGIPYPAFAESQHTFITGSPGSGKTVEICRLIDQIRKRGDRAIIYDKMGNFTKWFYNEKQDVLLNPMDARSASWSVFNEARTDADFDTMAEALIPTQKGAADPFWCTAARNLFSVACAVLYKRGVRDNKTLIESLLVTDTASLSLLTRGTEVQSLLEKENQKTALSIISTLITNVRSMKYLKDGGTPFSIRKWIEDEDNSNFLFITSSSDKHAAIKPLISTWLEVAINSLLGLEQSRERKIWIIIDELPSLHFLPSLAAGLAESRQFGGAFVLSLQVMSQLQAIYGQDVARSTSGLCQTRLVFKSSDPDTARSGSESLGGSETEEFKEGFSYGVSEARDGINTSSNRTTDNLVLPTEIMNMPNLTAYIRVGMNYPIAKIEIPYFKRKEIAKRFVLSEVARSLPVIASEKPKSIPKKKKKIIQDEEGEELHKADNSNEEKATASITEDKQVARNSNDDVNQIIEINRFEEYQLD